MPHRPEFNPNLPLVAARDFVFAGQPYSKGDPFPGPETAGASSFSRRLIERQYSAGAVNHAPDEPVGEASPVQMRPAARNGSYEISAPWLDEPEVVRGKVNAENRLAEIETEGPPLGWIDGGSAVTVSGPDDGGWYDVSAPWLAEPQRAQGREAAEALQRQLHDVGEPENHHGVTLRERPNGYWEVKAEWLDEGETVHGEDAARERAAQLRTDGPPAGWEPPASDQHGGDASQIESAGSADTGAGNATEGGAPAGGE